MSINLLTPAELEELTDRTQPAAQVRALRKLGIPFIWEGNGHAVKVMQDWRERHPVGRKSPREGFAAEPDFSMYERRSNGQTT